MSPMRLKLVFLFSGSNDCRRKRRRPTRWPMALLPGLMLVSRTLGYVSLASRRAKRTIRMFSKLDDLMHHVLHNQSFADLAAVGNSPTPTKVTAGWKIVDWDELASSADLGKTSPSPVEPTLVRDRLVYMKRDDLLRLPGSHLSGNKARKMYTLHGMREFPSCIVSYGGPQGNAMLALAAVVRFQNDKWGLQASDPNRRKLVYYTKKLPRFLRQQPSGNLFRALSLGMELVELSPQDYNDLFGGDWGGSVQAPKGLDAPEPGDSLWVPQGGACAMAKAGTRLLAEEILSFWLESGYERRPLSVCLPGGTCSTAALLHRAIRDLLAAAPQHDRMDIQVLVIPCVGDEGYARRQMVALNSQTGALDPTDIPTILSPDPADSHIGQSGQFSGYIPFGEPNASVLRVFREMRDHNNIMLDLLYGAPAWTILLRHWRTPRKEPVATHNRLPLAGREIMYIHSGGLEGVSSQLVRYKYKNLVELDEIQLPGRT